MRMKRLIKVDREVPGYLNTVRKALESLLDVGCRCKKVVESSLTLKFVPTAINHIFIHSWNHYHSLLQLILNT
jgi:hypothetical protein